LPPNWASLPALSDSFAAVALKSCVAHWRKRVSMNP